MVTGLYTVFSAYLAQSLLMHFTNINYCFNILVAVIIALWILPFTLAAAMTVFFLLLAVPVVLLLFG